MPRRKKSISLTRSRIRSRARARCNEGEKRKREDETETTSARLYTWRTRARVSLSALLKIERAHARALAYGVVAGTPREAHYVQNKREVRQNNRAHTTRGGAQERPTSIKAYATALYGPVLCWASRREVRALSCGEQRCCDAASGKNIQQWIFCIFWRDELGFVN